MEDLKEDIESTALFLDEQFTVFYYDSKNCKSITSIRSEMYCTFFSLHCHQSDPGELRGVFLPVPTAQESDTLRMFYSLSTFSFLIP